MEKTFAMPSLSEPAANVETYTPDLSTSNNAVLELLQNYLPIIAQGENINVELDIDSQRLFRVVQTEANRNYEITGLALV